MPVALPPTSDRPWSGPADDHRDFLHRRERQHIACVGQVDAQRFAAGPERDAHVDGLARSRREVVAEHGIARWRQQGPISRRWRGAWQQQASDE